MIHKFIYVKILFENRILLIGFQGKRDGRAMQWKVDSNRITCEKKGFIGFQFNHRRFSSLERNCHDSPRRSDTHTQCIYEAHRIVHTFARIYVRKALSLCLAKKDLSSSFQLLSATGFTGATAYAVFTAPILSGGCHVVFHL